MGVTVIQPYTLTEGKSGAQSIDYLSKRLLSLGATHTGQFVVDCDTFNSLTGRAVHVLHNSEYPASTFPIMYTETGKQLSLVADSIFDLLVHKMTNTSTSKKQTKIESRGARFEYGDFVIKLGSVTMMEHFKGILIEIEYKPCQILANCWEMIRELLQGCLNINVGKDFPSYFAPQTIMTAMGQQQMHHAKHNAMYEPKDTVKQYLEHFSNYRKHVSTQGSLSGTNGISGISGMATMGVQQQQ